VTAWKISALVPAHAAATFDAALGDALVDDSLVVASAETARDGPWRSDVIGESAPGGPDDGVRRRVAEAIADAARLAGIAPPAWTFELLPDIDWVVENQRSFRPFAVGPFWIHPSHDPGAPPDGAVPLQIEASLAFGTGTHATTRGCLEMLARLDPPPVRAIDVGCGSGILAIAMAKLWRRHVLGGDNDPEAIVVARENAALNAVGDLCAFHVADGLATPALAGAARWDLIVANILAGPLIALAPSFARAAAPDARLILSGLLAEQADDVRAACAAVGFACIDCISHESGGASWPTLLLRKQNGRRISPPADRV
jgi:ribosomal protein L11 methyltransferase